MPRATETLLGLFLTWMAAWGCGSSQSPAASPSESAPPPTAPPPNGSPGSGEGATGRPALTAEACEAGGGTVVGDIGDGAIHRPDYRCPGGSPPSGTIRAAEGAPMAVEGSVCCPK
jgi:hypothetical protein